MKLTERDEGIPCGSRPVAGEEELQKYLELSYAHDKKLKPKPTKKKRN
jgi:hypothetical protein